MPDRWVRLCRRLVPEPLRATAFDPAVADLEHAWLVRRSRHASAVAALAGRIALWCSIGVAAVECRRLAAGGVVVHRASSAARDGRLRTLAAAARQACRVFTRQPGLAAVVIATLALGIGANLTVFTIINQFLLAPLPVPNPAGLVRVHPITGKGDRDVISYPDYKDLRDGLTAVDLAAHAQPLARVGPADAGELRTVELVTGNYFRVVGLTPLAGRLIEEADDAVEGASPVVVLGAGFWRSRYGGSLSAIGQTLLINSTPFEIVGVAPEGYRGTFNAHVVDAWAPLAMQGQVRPQGQPREQRGWGWLSMIGRLRPGADAVSARRQADVIAADLTRRVPGRESVLARFTVSTASAMTESDRNMFMPAIGMAFGFTVLLLVVTCANLAGVMQARLIARRRDLAIRRSLGAGRGRLIGEWLGESLVLALAGGVAGLGGSRVAAGALAAIKLPAVLVGDLSFETHADWRVVGYAFGVSIAAGLLVGAMPAIRAGSMPPMALLKDDGATVVSGPRRARGRRAMVFLQVAASVVLLLSASLLTSSLGHQRSFDPGFDSGHLGILAFDFRRQGIPRSEWRSASDRILERVRQFPDVVQADLATSVPLGFGEDRRGFVIPGYVPADRRAYVPINYNVVGSRYFQALGLTFVRGESWAPTLQPGGAAPVVVNETMARRFWAGGDPVGKTIQVYQDKNAPTLTVTGVVRDSTYYEVGEAPKPFVYLPAEMQTPASFSVLLRTAGQPGLLMPQLARATAGVDKRFATYLSGTFVELRGVPLFPMRMLAGATSVFGMIAILLAAIGLYGVVSTSVSQRTREIGVRMALGARAGTVLRAVLRDALGVAAAGAAAGLIGGYLVAGQLSHWLFGVGRFDLSVYLGVAGVTVAIALLAAAVPARRAARIDPVEALRS